jgi:CRISPR-associated endonuclease Cas1 subtype II
MSWRTVVITKRCKLETKLGYMVCRGEQTKQIHLSEISSLIVESTSISLTSALLCELIKNKINIVFCDEKHNPASQLLSIYGRHDCSGKIREQIKWNCENKSFVWREIVKNKIYQQYLFLKEISSNQADLLKGYIEEIKEGDTSNREGHSAKVYFDVLFGLKFKRGDNTFINSALNYGYSLILSAFNREIVAQGYSTQIGIAHKNEFNYFNLSCDLMEPFRILVDRFVFCSEENEFTIDYKHSMINLFNKNVKIGGKVFSLIDAITIYSRSVFYSLETNCSENIKFYEL